jgi:ribosomal-protein-alanine N-acetyltransferase
MVTRHETLIKGSLVYLRPYETDDARALLDLRVRNADFFGPFEPRPVVEPPKTIEDQRRAIEQMMKQAARDASYSFGIFACDNDRLVGQIRLTQIFRGALQRAIVGYFVDEAENRKGYATEALRLAIRIAFKELGLHRVEAGAMPRNIASNRVLVKAGMRPEGYAPRYLQINGEWEDHNLFGLTAEEFTQD